jgi:hypothetical protein
MEPQPENADLPVPIAHSTIDGKSIRNYFGQQWWQITIKDYFFKYLSVTFDLRCLRIRG